MDHQAAPRPDGGRTMLEAVVGLTLIALAVLAWGRLSLTTARTESTVEHRDAALELASNTLESILATEWARVGIDPADPDGVRRFERARTVAASPGLPARTDVVVDDTTFTVTRHVTDSGEATWRRVTVIVEWDETGRTASVRLDGAARAPDGGTA